MPFFHEGCEITKIFVWFCGHCLSHMTAPFLHMYKYEICHSRSSPTATDISYSIVPNTNIRTAPIPHTRCHWHQNDTAPKFTAMTHLSKLPNLVTYKNMVRTVSDIEPWMYSAIHRTLIALSRHYYIEGVIE